MLPGNPDQSYLIQKIEGHAAVGARMPLGAPPLPQSTIDVIRQWIANGAQQGTRRRLRLRQRFSFVRLRRSMAKRWINRRARS